MENKIEETKKRGIAQKGASHYREFFFEKIK